MKQWYTLLFGLFSFTAVSQYTAIPDSNFESELINQGYDTAPIDGQVLTANISNITLLDVSNKNISDLTGIEDFAALQDLDLGLNNLTYLDLSHNSNLKRLWTLYNPLTCLNLQNGSNTNLVLFHTYQCPNLTCIQVDDPVYSDTTWINGNTGNPSVGYTYDSIVSFSDYCNECNVGIPETAITELCVSPNPTHDFIQLKGVKENGNLCIYDINGRLLHQANNISPKQEISLEGYPTEWLLIHFEVKDRTYTARILKEP